MVKRLYAPGVRAEHDARVRMCNKFYPWPCSLRVAHGPHGACPGVKIHPACMSGR